MPKISVDLSNVDWKLLRKQKLTLQGVVGIVAKSHPDINASDLSGLLHLLDSIQDQTAEIIGDSAVFGEEFASVETNTTNPDERSDK